MLSCPTYPAARVSLQRTCPRGVRKISTHFREGLSTAHERVAKINTVRVSKRDASSSSSNSPNDAKSSLPEPLTLLHKISSLVRRIPNRNTKGVSGLTRRDETTNILESVLSKAYNDLSATTDRPVKVTICGVDQWSGCQDLVTALLSDPLSSDETEIAALKERWKNPSVERIQFRHKSSPDLTPSTFASSSSYLTQFPFPLEICEIRPHTSTRSSLSLQHVLEDPDVIEADITIILFNPLTAPPKTILNTPLPSNGLVLLSSTSLTQTNLSEIIHHEQATLHHPRHHLSTPNVISVSPHKAVEAIGAIQASPTSLSAIQKYQDGFVDSGMSKVTNALKDKLQSSRTNKGEIRRKNALFHLLDVLNRSSANIEDLRVELDKAFVDTSILKERIEEMRVQVEASVLGRLPDEASGERKHGDVEDAITRAERDMRPVMDSLTWWSIFWRVDEISSTIASAITRTWCQNLEKKLILQTGRLAAMQDDVNKSALNLLSAHPTISTALLRNTLLQSKSSPNHRLRPDSLTQPILSRRNQMLEYPTARLHINGQKVVLGTAGGLLTGVGIGWAGWLGWLVGTGEGLLSFLGMEAGTAMGIGMLSAVASIRWAVGKWEKSKLRWWQDWARIGEGLDRDLKATLHESMDQQVVVVGDIACKGMSELIQTRDEELAKLETELHEVRLGVNGSINQSDKDKKP